MSNSLLGTACLPARLGWILKAILAAIPALVLIQAGQSQFRISMEMDAALPVPLYILRREPLTRQTYLDAADHLAPAGARDGQSAVLAAEARMDAGAPPEQQQTLIEHGLSLAPATTRGWILLSDSYAKEDRQKAARALSAAMLLSPMDYWTAGARVSRAARLWDALDQDGKDMALRQAASLWLEPALRRNLRPLLTSDDGIILMARAFATDRDNLRNMNRWLSMQRRYTAPRQP